MANQQSENGNDPNHRVYDTGFEVAGADALIKRVCGTSLELDKKLRRMDRTEVREGLEVFHDHACEQSMDVLAQMTGDDKHMPDFAMTMMDMNVTLCDQTFDIGAVIAFHIDYRDRLIGGRAVKVRELTAMVTFCLPDETDALFGQIKAANPGETLRQFEYTQFRM